MNDQLPPHCEQAEWMLAACGLEKPDILPDLDPTAFYCAAPRTLLERAQAMWASGTKDPQIPVLMELSRTSPELFFRAQNTLKDLPSPENWSYYLAEVEELATQRDTIRIALDMANGKIGPVEMIDRAKKLNARSKDDRTLNGQQCAGRLLDDLERRFNLRGARSGLVTGLHLFDELTDGLQFGEQTIIGARPSVGKTALACNIIERVCIVDGHGAALLTLEMSPEAISRRLLSSYAGISMRKLKTGQLGKQEFTSYARFQEMLKRQPLHMIDGVSGMDIYQVCAAVRRLHRRQPLKLVVVDYLQKIRPASRHEKRTYEVAEVSGMLRALAVETGAAFVTLAQLNRESERDKGRPPRLSDLADSGQIERDADCVGLLHRDRSTGEAMLIVAKQRDGEIGSVELRFNGPLCRFENAGGGSA